MSRGDALRKTTAQFIEQAESRHGERYDYSLVDYFNSVTPVTIICPTHGAFDQTPDGHLRGYGCSACGRAKPRRPTHRATTAGFIERARAKHPDEGYDYSLVEYVDQWTPVVIVCPTHGAFKQKPYVHLAKATRRPGYCGCPRCGTERASHKNRLRQEDFLTAARERHGDRYDYALARYRGASQLVTILCRDHGRFEQTAINHTSGGQGCPQCRIDGTKLTAVDFRARVLGVYDLAYEYPELGTYVTAAERIRVQCPEHGRFDVNSRTHLEGRSGCPDCTQSGSRFERQIQRALDAAGLVYVTEWTHPTLKDRGRLRFDFMLPDTKTLIEFDGAFHFKPIQMPGQSMEDAVRAFEEGKRRDDIKTAWARANGWTLVRLSTPHITRDLAEAGVLPTATLDRHMKKELTTP